MNKTYNTWKNYKFKFPFPDSDFIKETHSQAYQDIFVLSILSGQRNGRYLEIGCNVPDYTNNTYLLSKSFGWSGYSIDFLSEIIPKWQTLRPNDRLIIGNALTLDYKSLLSTDTVIDYLQLDIDPSINTLSALRLLPHDSCRFKVITFETDVYTGGNALWVKEESRNFLKNLGYELIVGDVIVDHVHPYEDWWVAPELVDMSVANSIKLHSKYTQNPAELLFE